MSTAAAPRPSVHADPRLATIDIVVPVYNEERALERNIRTLRRYLDERFPFASVVTIADNASTDRTWVIASRLAAQLVGVRAIHLPEKGRGRALKAAWSASEADVVAYMDVDLATDLDAILPLVAPLLSGHSDVAIGSRLARGAHVVRGPKREVISRAYNLIIRATMRNQFSDAQCGFKAVRADVARRLIPLIDDDGWFFDTELLVLAEHNGLRIHEVPVDWIDDPDSRVDIVATAVGDIKGLLRVSHQLATGRGQADVRPHRASIDTSRFLGIGGLSTLAYIFAFLGLRGATGGLVANAVALTICAAANYAAHRGTFRSQDSPAVEPGRFATASVAAWAGGLALSTVSLVVAEALSSSVVVALFAVLAANLVTSVARFAALQAIVFRRHLDALANACHLTAIAGSPTASRPR